MKLLFAHGVEPSAELLRLRDLQKWLRVSRDRVESLEATGRIKPFRKHPGAKALYRKWQFLALVACRSLSRGNQVPPGYLVRRLDVIDWLGVTKTEFESWVRCGLLHPWRDRENAKALFYVEEIEMVILGRPATRPFPTFEKLRADLINDSETRFSRMLQH